MDATEHDELKCIFVGFSINRRFVSLLFKYIQRFFIQEQIVYSDSIHIYQIARSKIVFNYIVVPIALKWFTKNGHTNRYLSQNLSIDKLLNILIKATTKIMMMMTLKTKTNNLFKQEKKIDLIQKFSRGSTQRASISHIQ